MMTEKKNDNIIKIAMNDDTLLDDNDEEGNTKRGVETLHVDIDDIITSITDNEGISETIKKEFLTEAKRTRSRSDWSELIILFTALSSIDKTVEDIDDLMERYKNVEKVLVVRIYPRFLLQSGVVRPKTYIAGKEHVDVMMFYEGYKMFVKEVEEYADKVKTIEKTRITELKNVLSSVFADKLKDIPDDKLKSLLDFIMTIETKRMKNISDDVQQILMMAESMCDEKNVRFEFPQQSVIEMSKDFRELLMKTQSVGRQAEIFFTFYFGRLLYQHPQLRKDYGDVEKFTNALFQSLTVTRGELDLDGNNVADALKKIMKALENIKGDFNALRLVLSLNVRKQRETSIQEWFDRLGKKKKKST